MEIKKIEKKSNKCKICGKKKALHRQARICLKCSGLEKGKEILKKLKI